MRETALRLALVSDLPGFEALRAPWRALHSRLDCPHLFQSFEWYWNAWIGVAERRGYRLCILTGHIDSRLVLVLPLMEDGPILRMLSPEMLAYRDVIVEPSKDAGSWVRQGWSYVASSTRAHAFFLQDLRYPAALREEVPEVSTLRPVERAWCPVIRLDRFPNWDAYATTLPKSLLSDQRRQWKRVHQVLHRVSFRVVDKCEEIPSVIDWISRHKIDWAQGRGQRATWFETAEKRDLMTAVAESAMSEGKLVMVVLCGGHKPVSAGWGFLYGREFLFYAFAYDAAYATYSPSRLLLERLIQLCFDRGVCTFDFMPGEESYKRTWATDYVQIESYVGVFRWRGTIALRVASVNLRALERFPALKRLYEALPDFVRDLASHRLRKFRLLRYALNLKLRGRPPLDP